jgi:hypothetical protein
MEVRPLLWTLPEISSSTEVIINGYPKVLALGKVGPLQ